MKLALHKSTSSPTGAASASIRLPTLLGLGTATPEHRMSQAESLKMFTDIVCEDERQARMARVLYKKSEVENRHTCVPHQVAYNWCQPATVDSDAPRNNLTQAPAVIPQVTGGSSHGPTTLERMRLYAEFASDLALKACQRALDSAAMEPSEITHLVTVSCTGFDAPGVDIELIYQLGLPPSTQRINVGFMGCHGAINGLRAALGIAGADANARVLVCCVELCSLHYRFKWDSEGIVGNALFADGAAAVVISQATTTNEIGSESSSLGSWELVDTGSLVLADSKQAMSWRVGDHGFEMLLTSEVGDKIEAGLTQWLNDWLAIRELTLKDVNYWGVHPGGPRILSAVQNSLELSNDALSTSRNILQLNGNMSSPTVLFILNEFLQQYAVDRSLGCDLENPRHCVLLAFGPGLVAEIAMFRTKHA